MSKTLNNLFFFEEVFFYFLKGENGDKSRSVVVKLFCNRYG